MIAALTTGPDGWVVQLCQDDGVPAGPVLSGLHADQVSALEAADQPRWVWESASISYPPLLAAGITVERCHDLALTERILLGRAARFGEPVSAAAIVARADGSAVPAAPQAAGPGAEPTLFDADQSAAPAPTVDQLRVAYLNQRERVSTVAASPVGEDIDIDPGALRLLIAAESASALVAAEMGRTGIPWDADIHRQVLAESLGPQPRSGQPPAVLAELADQAQQAFGFPVNLDSTTELRDAFRRAGFDLETTRSWVLRDLDHPAVPAVLAYKELSRLHTANGWSWLAQWVRDGRFRAEYVPGGVVSGRWATRGGGALQIPKVVRRAVVPVPGYRLVVADAAQLEPRVLIALSGDPRLAELAEADDLYAALAGVGFAGQRSSAKLAMLGAMYGATSGGAGQLLATLRMHFPVAMGFVEHAARRGEQGKQVASVLGRAAPRPGPDWWDTVQAGAQPEASAAAERRARQTARSWGRFTRNFVIQASAADWAAVWLSCVRRDLRRQVPAAELVFFQHDELMVHVPDAAADQVARLISAAADEACRLVFAAAPRRCRVPVRPVIVTSYAGAK